MILHGIKNSIKLMKLAGAKKLIPSVQSNILMHIMAQQEWGRKKNSVVNKMECHDIHLHS